ncbi:SPERT protein, partial [Alectura lathami]|nr:SPERT protein [Alectura lathami]
AMSAFDLTNQSMQCTKPEMDSVFPWMKPRDESFVFIDGTWVNETFCQPPLAPQWQLLNKMVQNEWSIWEENRALWEENQVLRIENRVLWEENKALKCLQSQNKTVQLVYNDTTQQNLQKDSKLFPFFAERDLRFQVSPSNKVLQEVRERSTVLDVVQQENKTVPTLWKKQKSITVHEENNSASSFQKATKDTAAAEEKPSPAPQHEAKEKSTTATQTDTKTAPSTQDDNKILQALHDLYPILQVFLREYILPGDRESLHALHDERNFFQEEYKKLKLQLNAVKNAMSDITTQMETLEQELIAISFAMYAETGKKMASECHLGEM